LGQPSDFRRGALGADGDVGARDGDLAAIEAMERGDAVAPPELTRDAPVADVVHPFEVGLRPVLRHDLDAAGFDGGDRLFGERLHADEPLLRDQRLDDGFAAVALSDGKDVGLDLDEDAGGFEIGDDAAASLEAVEAGIGPGLRGHERILADDFDPGEVVALAALEVVGVVRGCDFDDAGAELRVGQFVEHDGDLAVHQRENYAGAAQVGVPLVGRIDGDGGVAEHRFGTSGRHCEEAIGVSGDGVLDVPEIALLLFVLNLEVA
jgi:hypothetical protein